MAIKTIPIENYLPYVRINDGIYTAKAITTTSDLVVGGGVTITGAIGVTGLLNASTAGLRTKQAVNNVHDTTPTAAELAISFGAASGLGRGFIGTVDDNDGDAISYIVWTSDASFYFVIGTKAS